MKRVNLMIILSLMIIGLFATFTATPKIMMAEIGNDLTAAQEQDAQDGIAATDAAYNQSYWVSAQYFNGDYGNEDTEAMIELYQMTDLPTAVFNGIDTIVGGGTTVADGTDYSAMVEAAKFDASPINIAIDEFDTSNGNIAVTVTMLSDTYEISGGTIRFVLIEDEITGMEHVTRQILAQDISITGQETEQTFNDTFTIETGWALTNLYAIVYVQNADHSIVQTASTYTVPENAYRIGVPFDTAVTGPAYEDEMYQYESEHFYVKNFGSETTFTASIEVISAPESWMIMFCHVTEAGEGGCHPAPWEFTLGAGESMAFDFNIPNIDSNGNADFNFIIQPAHGETQTINFTYETGNAAGDDTVPYVGATLDQNMPNPFNPETTIHFALPSDVRQNTRLVIYNVRGQEVRSFSALATVQGEGKVTWDGKDNRSNDVTSGVYYYRLEGETNTPAKKMLLLK